MDGTALWLGSSSTPDWVGEKLKDVAGFAQEGDGKATPKAGQLPGSPSKGKLSMSRKSEFVAFGVMCAKPTLWIHVRPQGSTERNKYLLRIFLLAPGF